MYWKLFSRRSKAISLSFTGLPEVWRVPVTPVEPHPRVLHRRIDSRRPGSTGANIIFYFDAIIFYRGNININILSSYVFAIIIIMIMIMFFSLINRSERPTGFGWLTCAHTLPSHLRCTIKARQRCRRRNPFTSPPPPDRNLRVSVWLCVYVCACVYVNESVYSVCYLCAAIALPLLFTVRLSSWGPRTMAGVDLDLVSTHAHRYSHDISKSLYYIYIYFYP